jgi:hypothetical protein
MKGDGLIEIVLEELYVIGDFDVLRQPAGVRVGDYRTRVGYRAGQRGILRELPSDGFGFLSPV